MNQLLTMKNREQHTDSFVSTRNACKLCAPLGASVAYKGIEGCVPLIHGSQGCATYVRRYLISHFKEPVDIASSGFNEESTIFGGGPTLKVALKNVDTQYSPQMIGISTTCLSETIGDDVSAILKEYKQEQSCNAMLSHASTPSYCGTHVDGFHQAVLAVLQQMVKPSDTYNDAVVLMPGFLSPADYLHLKEIFAAMKQELILLPDLSVSLDNPTWDSYTRIPEGGTPMKDIQKVSGSKGFIQFGTILNAGQVAGKVKNTQKSSTPAQMLVNEYGMPGYEIRIPIGIHATDAFFKSIKKLTGKTTPAQFEMERGRLIDAYADGHKYVFGKKAVLYGEEDFVVAMTSFLMEIGIQPIIIASGGKSGRLQMEIDNVVPENAPQKPVRIEEAADFESIAEWSREMKPDIIIGHSKGYYIARELDIPIVRVGFPIHDRLGGQRLLHVGYRGTHRLFEQIANALIEYKQAKSAVGYKYM